MGEKDNTVTIRGLNRTFYRMVKAVAAERNRKVSQCINEALIDWLQKVGKLPKQ